MADITINQLPSGTLALTDNLPRENTSDVDAKISGQQIVDLASANVQITEAQVTNLPSDLADRAQGPASSSNNALVRFDGTTGKLLKNSSVLVTDAGDVTGIDTLLASNVDAVIGAISPQAGNFTFLQATNIDNSIINNSSIGSVTPLDGTFTRMRATSDAIIQGSTAVPNGDLNNSDMSFYVTSNNLHGKYKNSAGTVFDIDLTNASENRTMFFAASTDGATSLSGYPVQTAAEVGGTANIGFQVPGDFTQLISIHAIGIKGGTAASSTANMSSFYGNISTGTFTQFSGSSGLNTGSLNNGDIFAFDLSPLYGSLGPSQIAAFTINHTGIAGSSDFHYVAIRLVYS